MLDLNVTRDASAPGDSGNGQAALTGASAVKSEFSQGREASAHGGERGSPGSDDDGNTTREVRARSLSFIFHFIFHLSHFFFIKPFLMD